MQTISLLGSRRAWCGLLIALVSVGAAALGASAASAATVTWTGFSGGPCTPPSQPWSVTGGPCWSTVAPPADGDDVVLATQGLVDLGDYDISRTLNSITLNTAPAFAITSYTINNADGFLLGLQSGGFITDNNTEGADAINTGITLNGPATFTLSAGATGLSFGVHPITGTGPLTLVNNSTGALILAAANTYTGATAVNAGTVTVTGSLVSPVTVQSGGTLAGTGTIANTVTVQSGGALAPGLSTGIIETGNLTLNGGSILTIELNGPMVGDDYDQVLGTGTVNLGGATLNVGLGFTPSAGDVFTIIDNDGTDLVNGTFAGLPEGATLSVGGALFRVSYRGGDGNDVTLSFIAEPSYDFIGFFQPVNNEILNVAKAGQAIPVKFSLNGDHGLDIMAPGYPTAPAVGCTAGAPTDNLDEVVNAGRSSLAYDPATDTYIYVWKTDKAWANTCRELIVKLADGSEHKAQFKFIK